MGRDIERAGEPAVYSDVVALDRELFARVAQSHPGVIRTLGVLLAELSELDGLAPDFARALGEHLRRVGDTVIRRAERTCGHVDAD